jgi:hypothetical protein
MIHLFLLILALGFVGYLVTIAPILEQFKKILVAILFFVAIIAVFDAFGYTHILPATFGLRR